MSNSIVQHSHIIRTNILSLDNEANHNMLSRIPYIDEVKNVVFNVDNWTWWLCWVFLLILLGHCW